MNLIEALSKAFDGAVVFNKDKDGETSFELPKNRSGDKFTKYTISLTESDIFSRNWKVKS